MSEQPKDDTPPQPGDLTRKLQTIRERAGMSMEQAAIDMRLALSIVRALENEKLDELPDPPYVRGYLRTYARLDDSDAQDLIHTYEVLRGAEPKQTYNYYTSGTHQTAQVKRATQSNNTSLSPTALKLLSLVGLLVLLGLLSLVPGVAQWAGNLWQSFSSDSAQPKVATIATTPLDSAGAIPRKPGDANTPSSNVSAQGAITQPIESAVLADSSSLQDTPASSSGDKLAQDATNPDGELVWADQTTENTDASNAAKENNETAETSSSTTPNAEETATNTAADANSSVTGTNHAGAETSADAEAATAIPDGTTAIGLVEPGQALIPTATPSTPTEPLISGLDNNNDSTHANSTTSSTTADSMPTAIPETTASTTPQQTSSATSRSTRRQPIDGTVRVRMEFYEDAWMQIKDGSGRIIFEALNTANTWKEFKTRTPLSFKVGNARGVKLYLNGQLYDQDPHTRGNVSAFTVN